MIPSKKTTKIFLLFIIIIIGVSCYFYIHKNEVSTDDASIDGQNVVVSPKVQGYIKNLYVQDNQLVHAGDILLEIDPTDYQIKRDQEEAALLAAKAAVNTAINNKDITSVSAPSNRDAAAAQVASQQALWEKSRNDRERIEKLYAVGACSRQQLDQAIATEKSDHSTLNKLESNFRAVDSVSPTIAAAQNTVEQLEAKVTQAEADLRQAEANLANTKIIAPIDGRITKRSINEGSYVQIGQQLLSLVSSTDIWIIANFKENQMENIKPGQLVDIRIDAYPNVHLKGKVDSIQSGTGSYFSLFPTENATGNFVKVAQRIPVKIIFDTPPNSQFQLGSGMSVIPTVYTESTGLHL